MVGCHALLQGIFPTQGSNPHLLCLLHCRRLLYHRATRKAVQWWVSGARGGEGESVLMGTELQLGKTKVLVTDGAHGCTIVNACNDTALYTQKGLKRENLCYVCCSVTKSCPALCDPVDGSTPGFPVLHCLLERAQTHVHRVGDAIQPSHPLSSPSPPALNLSQHLGLFR